MKRVFVLVLTLCMLFCSCGKTGTSDNGDAENNAAVHDGVYTVSELGENYKTQGRTIVYEDKGIALLSTADAFEFNADCEGKVSVNLFGEKMEDSPRDIDCYFTAYVDGERSETRHHVTDGEYELVLAENIEKGEHNFKIVRQNEWKNGRVYVQAVNCAGELMAAPAQKDVFIEFIGDSIATGFGNLPEIEYESDWGGHPIWQDGTQAFAYMAAQQLDVDYSIVAIEGIESIGGYWDFTMNEIYENYPRVYEKDYTYDPERKADIVVVELFSNDQATMREDGYTPSDIVVKGKELIEMARAKHPDSKIVVSPGAFPKKFITLIEEELGGAENGYYYIDMPMDTAGKSGHPTVAGQTAACDALVELLETLIEQ